MRRCKTARHAFLSVRPTRKTRCKAKIEYSFKPKAYQAEARRGRARQMAIGARSTRCFLRHKSPPIRAIFLRLRARFNRASRGVRQPLSPIGRRAVSSDAAFCRTTTVHSKPTFSTVNSRRLATIPRRVSRRKTPMATARVGAKGVLRRRAAKFHGAVSRARHHCKPTLHSIMSRRNQVRICARNGRHRVLDLR